MNYFKFSNHKKGLLYACGTTLCWAILAILLKHALTFTDPQTIVAFRMIFAFSLSLPLLLLTTPQHLKILKKPPPLVILGSLGLALNYLGFMNGVALSTASNAQVMIQIGPLALMLIGFFLYKDPIRKSQVIWLFIALSGFYLFFKDQTSFDNEGHLLKANIWIIVAALSWAAYSLMIKKFTGKGYSTSELNLVVFLTCSLVLFFGVNKSYLLNLSFSNWIFLLVLGLNTLIAYSCFGQALKYAPASQVSLIITTNPILTLLIIVFGSAHSKYIPYEPVGNLGYFGALLISIGVASFTLSAQKKKT